MQYDVAVVGLGGMGSAILAHCASRGGRVIGLEQFDRGHEFGASSGKSRLIRKAYFEDPAYVPLLVRAYALWRALERATDEEILRITGLLLVGREDGEVISGAQRSAREHSLPIEFLRRREVQRRYPTLRIEEDEVGVFESEAGVLNPERAVQAQLQVAQASGAELRFRSAFESWQPIGRGFEILLADHTRITTRVLVLALGPWFKTILESLGVELRVQRNIQAWFTPRTEAYNVARFPAFLLERRGLPAALYGFPDCGDGIKAAFHGHGAFTDAQHLARDIDPTCDIEPLAHCLEQWMPGSVETLREAKACMYSLTPDEHFVIDRHPAHWNLILCGGFSGHGFKFSPVVGEIVAELALDGGTRHAIEFLSLGRFSPRSFN